MKTIISLIMIMTAIAVSGCSSDSTSKSQNYASFSGEVSGVSEHSITVDVTDGDILSSSDCVIAKFSDDVDIDTAIGDVVQIWYDGDAAETYPAEVNAVSYEVIQAEE